MSDFDDVDDDYDRDGFDQHAAKGSGIIYQYSLRDHFSSELFSRQNTSPNGISGRVSLMKSNFH
jgi:hypothetical protein